ncbi:hypothetical protein L596_001495 [Steinernema carpocapsae]|uniref:Uncharacterized protein n=1 Tax=Steinernema carpocapsae TaxID=34508 RepID=A0A4U8UQE5_STECR|nr:hypothetical protein L596_001495 [Steinernema carpocapsae]
MGVLALSKPETTLYAYACIPARPFTPLRSLNPLSTFFPYTLTIYHPFRKLTDKTLDAAGTRSRKECVQSIATTFKN